MSYFTELNAGLFNAWTAALFACLFGMSVMIIDKKTARRLIDMSWYTAADKRAAYASMVMQYGFIILAVWVPFKTGTTWFYTGAVIYVAALVCYTVSMYNYAKTPLNEPVRKGLYRLSRNPIYFFYSLMCLALCIASASLPLFVAWLIYNIPTHRVILGEERYCSGTYGESYVQYMRNVSRYFAFF